MSARKSELLHSLFFSIEINRLTVKRRPQLSIAFDGIVLSVIEYNAVVPAIFWCLWRRSPPTPDLRLVGKRAKADWLHLASLRYDDDAASRHCCCCCCCRRCRRCRRIKCVCAGPADALLRQSVPHLPCVCVCVDHPPREHSISPDAECRIAGEAPFTRCREIKLSSENMTTAAESVELHSEETFLRGVVILGILYCSLGWYERHTSVRPAAVVGGGDASWVHLYTYEFVSNFHM